MRRTKVALGNYPDGKVLNGEFGKFRTYRGEQCIESFSGSRMTASVKLFHRLDISA